jgi:hypothetical protein
MTARSSAAALAACALLAAGCGGGEEKKSDEDLAKQAAVDYMSTYANKQLDQCRALVTKPGLCGDDAPLAERVNSEARRAVLMGNTAKVTVTGSADILLELDLVKQAGDWKVSGWRAAGRQ